MVESGLLQLMNLDVSDNGTQRLRLCAGPFRSLDLHIAELEF